MSTAIATMADIERMATAVAKSGLFGVKKVDEAIALMLVAQAEGRHPALAARDYDIIQGRPAKKAEAMLRDFLESGGKVQWHALDDTTADATFSHPSGGSVRIEWTMKRAAAAGLGGRDMWKKYPRQMLRSRTVSEGIRTVCPMATSGMYVPEEVQDIVKEKDITPRAGAGDSLTPERIQEIKELHTKAVEWINTGSVADALAEIDNAALEADEKTFLWDMFDSKQRSAMKKEIAKQKEAAAIESNLITEAQKKRLEARIAELGLSRDNVKKYCLESYNTEHFSELTKEQYAQLDETLESQAVATQA